MFEIFMVLIFLYLKRRFEIYNKGIGVVKIKKENLNYFKFCYFMWLFGVVFWFLNLK